MLRQLAIVKDRAQRGRRIGSATEADTMTGTAGEATMYCYPWDLAGPGLMPRFRRLSEAGISMLQLAVSYHAATFLMPNQPARLVFGTEPGAIYFEPSPSLLKQSAGLAPHVAADTFELAGLIETAADAGLEVTAWTVFCYNHSLARKYPEHAVRSAFGERHIAQLCPNDAAVRDYFSSLTSELTERYRFAGIVFESLSFLPFSYGWLNTKASVTIPHDLNRLLSTCFCDSCMGIACGQGIDARQVQAQVRTVCRRELNRLPLPTGSHSSLSGLDLDAVEKYRAATRTELTGFHSGLLERVGHAGMTVDSTATYDSPTPEMTGIDHSCLRHSVHTTRISVRPDIPADEVRRVVEAKQADFPGSRVDVLIEPGDYQSGGSFLNTLAACRAAGANNFRFYSLSTVTEAQLGWLEAGKHYWSDPTV